ncbi:uncharacterized protein EI90DRAFT_3071593 [Cantharellus anzutake]|uniref:uncharacterized protein n=1 Tax=Cantharellus anzutake TaxID=1750568 RepID=UPI00190697CE|nr:uncharacterized protein EI90DRAFT_3071593 [Cantharellus anzutake]KAF8326124.1 hypothetical protein EI90DRAFT_3071593 [Cantharellus anzutake]
MDLRNVFDKPQHHQLGDGAATASKNETLYVQLPSHPPNDPSEKGISEMRKVLSLIITRLRDREKPPSVFAQLASEADKKHANRIDAMVASFKDAVRKANAPKPDAYGAGGSGDEDVAADAYSTDETLDLMTQLRHTLLVARKKGWELLPSKAPPQAPSDRSRTKSPTPRPSPFRRRKTTPERAQSSELAYDEADIRSACLDLVAQIVEEDCRYRVQNPRLKAPPHALQAVTLDVALAVLEPEPKPHTLSAVAFALIPGFYTFHPRFHSRLLQFFEEAILGTLLELLQKTQGSYQLLMESTKALEFSALTSTPTIAISIEGEGKRTSSHSLWSATGSNLRILSTTAPFQAMDIYRLGSVVPPLLSAVLDCVEINDSSVESLELFRAVRVLEMIAAGKLDSYLDLLQVIAYHSSEARYRAYSVLASFWPEVIGHVTASVPFPVVSKPPRPRDVKRLKVHGNDNPFDHQFIPWRFQALIRRSTVATTGGPSALTTDYPTSCQVCNESISGFGLKCVLCPCALHFMCYDSPAGSFFSQYPSAQDSETQRLAVTRFSRILPRRKGELDCVSINNHHFHIVNLFTLTLCFVCRLPIWGCTLQGLRCDKCHLFVHHTCISDQFNECNASPPTSKLVTIDWTDMRKSFVAHYFDVLLTEEQIYSHSFEDISILQGVLWTQLQILMNGIASGSIIIEQPSPSTDLGRENRVEEFELQYCVRIYEAYLASGRNPKSSPLEYYQRLHRSSVDTSILFDWSLLLYIVATSKCPPAAYSGPDPGGLLSVQTTLPPHPPSPPQVSEIVSLAHIRDVLGSEMNVKSDVAAKHLLRHVHTLGFFRRVDGQFRLFDDRDAPPNQIFCIFPLPVLLDTSVDVETLVAAIEASLADIDLSVNESALLLLNQRCPPNIWASEYGLGRLARAILSWICTDDDRLIRVATEFASQKRPLPGVLPASTAHLWPPLPVSRPETLNSSTSGGEYVSARRVLLNRYIVPWMRALHALDANSYAGILFDFCRSQAAEKWSDPISLEDDVRASINSTDLGDEMLRIILKLCHSSVILSCFDAVFVSWLDAVSGMNSNIQPVPYPFLPRLFNMDAEALHYASQSEKPAATELNDGWQVDPWKVITDGAAEGPSGMQRTLRWLELLARSGVSIPVSTYKQMAAYLRDSDAAFEMHQALTRCFTATCWLKSHGAQDLLGLIATIHDRLAGWISINYVHDDKRDKIDNFIRLSMAACLLLYGFDREYVVSIGLIEPSEQRDFPTRRKFTGFGAIESATLALNIELVNILSRYVTFLRPEISVLVAAFLDSVVSDSSPLGKNEVDSFITINAYALNTCVWSFYGLQLPKLSLIRSPLLLKLLIVDSKPMEMIITETLSDPDSGHRQLAIQKMHLISLDINSEPFQMEDRQWRHCVVPVLRLFFASLWNDPSEENRQIVDVACQSFLQVHLDAISRCWDESLLKAPIGERVRLVRFLLRLHPYFPTWRVLSWDAIVDSMLEDDLISSHGVDDGSNIIAQIFSPEIIEEPSNESDMTLLRTLLVSLSLQFIGDGIRVDVFTVLKIKHHLARVLSFSESRLMQNVNGTVHIHLGSITSIPPTAYPCISSLKRAIDGPGMVDLAPSAMGFKTVTEANAPCLAGSVFDDIVIAVITSIDVVQLPYLVARSWLEIVVIIILKHDFDHPALHPLNSRLVDTVKRLVDNIRKDVNQELCQLSLSVSHALLQTRGNWATKILSRQIFAISSMVVDLDLKPEHVLVAQGIAFLESAFEKFVTSGLFKSLFKNDPLPHRFFDVLSTIIKSSASQSEETLPNEIIRTVLEKMFDLREGETDRDLFASVGPIIRNLADFVVRVHHKNLSNRLLQDIALGLTNIARKTAEWPSSAFNPNPLFFMVTTIIQHNKARCKDILLHLETLLRACLVRFDVHEESLDYLFKVTGSLISRTNSVQFDLPPQHLPLAVVDTLVEELKGRGRSSVATLLAMLRTVSACLISDPSIFTADAQWRLANSAAAYLELSHATERFTDYHFKCLVVVSHIVLTASEEPFGNSIINDVMGSNSNRNDVSLRCWAALGLAALETPRHRLTMLQHVANFGLSYSKTLQHLAYPEAVSGWAPVAAAAMSSAFAAMKIWILLAWNEDVLIEEPDEACSFERIVWNEVWPPFEKVINVSMSSSFDPSLPITSVIWGSYVDLVIFLMSYRSILMVDTSVTHALLLEKLSATTSDAMHQKLARALQAIQHPPPQVPRAQLINRARSDLLASEKLTQRLQILGPKEQVVKRATG